MKRVLIVFVLVFLIACGGGSPVSQDPPAGRTWSVFDVTCYSGGKQIFSGQVARLGLGERTHLYEGDEQVGNIVFLPDDCVFIATGDKFTN